MSVASEPFLRLVRALRPRLNDVVFVGGWAHRLYQHHPSAMRLPYAPLMTDDADVALPLDLPDHEPSILQLLQDAGFEQELLGEDRPPVTHYHLGKPGHGFYAEFVTTKRGPDRRRSGDRDMTATIAGISAQKLKHVDILLNDPWKVVMEEVVRVANPVAFLVQKILVLPHRGGKQANDILYIHDTLALFGSRPDDLVHLWNALRAKLSHRTIKEFHDLRLKLFQQVDDRIRRAAIIARAAGRAADLTPENIRGACRIGLGRVFGFGATAAVDAPG